MVGTYSAKISNYINMSMSNNILNLQGNRQNSNRCATVAGFFFSCPQNRGGGGSEVKGLLISKCAEDIY